MVTTIALYLLLLSSTSHAHFPPFNASVSPLSATLSSSSSPPFLKEVLKAIEEKERWDPKGEVRVLEVDAGSARIRRSHWYEFHVRVGRTDLLLRLADEVLSWRNLVGGEEIGPDLTASNARGRRPAVRALELEGPLDLRVGNGDDELSLLLPAMNITYEGLRRVLVGDGITIKIEGAQEVSLVHPHSAGLALNISLGTHKDDRSPFWPLLGYPSCAPLLSVRVVGSASLSAYRTRNSEAHIETTAHRSRDTVELLPDKCYSNGNLRPVNPLPQFRPLLDSRLSAAVEEVLESVLSHLRIQNRSTRVLKSKITSSTLVKFRMELERNVTKDDRVRRKVAEWRTNPAVERHSFEVVARVDDDGGRRVLDPVVFKKVKKRGGITVADSTAWSNLMSNVSFTQFPSVVVLPEALTLDVKW